MKGTSANNWKRTISTIVEEARDGALEPERRNTLLELLAASPEARRYYLETNLLMAALAGDDTLAPGNEADYRRSSAPRFAWNRKTWALGTIAVVLLLFVFGIGYFAREDNDAAQVIAAIDEFRGSATVTTVGAQTRPLTVQMQISSGDTIRTSGALSSAVIVFSDGTRFSMFGDSALTASDQGQKTAVFHGGTLFASVTPQPIGRPLVIATPQDRVQVMGTRFSLDATKAHTDMSVSEGRVLLTRLNDGRSVEVPAGHRVVSRAAAAFVMQPILTTPDVWSEDFEEGLPEGWLHGKLVASDPAPNSQFGVQAVEVLSDQGLRWEIATKDQWTQGLFAVHEDTHLHIRLKMANPGWFNILILTKISGDDSPTFAGNYIYDKPAWFGQPGEWGEITIPLSEFRPLAPAPEAFSGVIPIQVVLSSPDKDRGLVIDRIWVDRHDAPERKRDANEDLRPSSSLNER